MSQNAQLMRDRVAPVGVAKTLGYHSKGVGVPTMNAFGEQIPSAPPYAFNSPNPMPMPVPATVSQ